MPGDPEECRKHAKCCLEMAKSAPSLISKMRFEGMAHTWLRLANDLELPKRCSSIGVDPKHEAKKTG